MYNFYSTLLIKKSVDNQSVIQFSGPDGQPFNVFWSPVYTKLSF